MPVNENATVTLLKEVNSSYYGEKLIVVSINNGRANLSKDGDIVIRNIPIKYFREI